jgi:uncharacterized protein (TIRG00374 family)
MAKLLVKVAISCVLLGLLLWRVPLGGIGAHMRSLDPATLLEVLGISLGCWVIAAARQWCLLPRYRYRDLLQITFVARFYAMVLPGQIAGDVVKAYRLGRQSNHVGHAEAATLLDRGLGVFALFLISAVTVLHSPRLPLALRLFFVLGAVGLLAGGVLAGSRLFRRGVVERFMAQRKGRMAIFVREFSIALHEYLHRPITLIAALLIALIFHAGCILLQVLLGDALGIKLPWTDWTVVYAGVSLLMLLPISVAGLGLREGGYVGLLAIFGYKASAALSLSFAILGATLVATLVGGGLELIDAVNRSRAAATTGRSTRR